MLHCTKQLRQPVATYTIHRLRNSSCNYTLTPTTPQPAIHPLSSLGPLSQSFRWHISPHHLRLIPSLRGELLSCSIPPDHLKHQHPVLKQLHLHSQLPVHHVQALTTKTRARSRSINLQNPNQASVHPSPALPTTAATARKSLLEGTMQAVMPAVPANASVPGVTKSRA